MEILESGDKELIKLRPICLALDVELMAMQGYRLLESESGHYLTEDWISNVCLMYAYDFQQDQYLGLQGRILSSEGPQQHV